MTVNNYYSTVLLLLLLLSFVLLMISSKLVSIILFISYILLLLLLIIIITYIITTAATGTSCAACSSTLRRANCNSQLVWQRVSVQTKVVAILHHEKCKRDAVVEQMDDNRATKACVVVVYVVFCADCCLHSPCTVTNVVSTDGLFRLRLAWRRPQ